MPPGPGGSQVHDRGTYIVRGNPYYQNPGPRDRTLDLKTGSLQFVTMTISENYFATDLDIIQPQESKNEFFKKCVCVYYNTVFVITCK